MERVELFGEPRSNVAEKGIIGGLVGAITSIVSKLNKKDKPAARTPVLASALEPI